MTSHQKRNVEKIINIHAKRQTGIICCDTIGILGQLLMRIIILCQNYQIWGTILGLREVIIAK